LCLRLAGCALQSQHDLLRSFCLLVEDGLRLTTIPGLFAIITTLSLREKRRLSGLVLGDFVLCMLSAVFALAVGASCLWDVDLGNFSSASILHSCSRMLPQSFPCNQSCTCITEALVLLPSSTKWHPRGGCEVFQSSSIEQSCRLSQFVFLWRSMPPSSSPPSPMAARKIWIYIPF